jgi:hypothetical protein
MIAAAPAAAGAPTAPPAAGAGAAGDAAPGRGAHPAAAAPRRRRSRSRSPAAASAAARPPGAAAIRHCCQRGAWDCGVACVLMALQALGRGGGASHESLAAACGTSRCAPRGGGLGWGQQAGAHAPRAARAMAPCTAPHTRPHAGTRARACPGPSPLPTHLSIWTIDLAHLLARAGARPALATLTAGVEPGYAGVGFYAPHFDADAARVARLFEGAADAGVDVQLRRCGAARGGRGRARPWSAPARRSARRRMAGACAPDAPVPPTLALTPGCSVPLDELCGLLADGRHLVIALVDKRVVDPEGCRRMLEAQARERAQGQPQSAEGAGPAASPGPLAPAPCPGGGDPDAAGGLPARPEEAAAPARDAGGAAPAQACRKRKSSSGGERGGGREQRPRPADAPPGGDGSASASPAAAEAAAPGGAAAAEAEALGAQHEPEPEPEPQAAAGGARPAAGYLGHYLLLVGYDEPRRCFLAHDPDKPCGPCEVDAAALEEGRRAYGTDEDLLLIPLQG